MNDIYNLFFYIIDLILIGNRLELKRNRGVSWYKIFEKKSKTELRYVLVKFSRKIFTMKFFIFTLIYEKKFRGYCYI